MIVATLTNIGALICLTIAWGFAVMGGLNQGVITSCMNTIAIFDMIVFYCAFGEKVNTVQIIGVIFMLAGIGFIAAATSVAEEPEEGDEEIDTGGRTALVNGLLSIGLAICAALQVSFQHYVIRKFSTSYTGIDQNIDLACPQNLIFALFLIWLCQDITITWGDILLGGLAGFLFEFGRLNIAYSIDKGIAGPVNAMIAI